MRTPYPEIRRCLDAHLITLLPVIGLEQTDMAWPNAGFTPVDGRMYLRPWCMYGDTYPVSLGVKGFERLVGVYQVSVLEVADTGMERAENTARAIADHFRGGTRLDCCGFELCVTTAHAGGAMQDDGRLHIPVSVNWRCDTQK